MSITQRVTLTLLTVFILVSSQNIYELDDDGAHGVRISGNDYFTIAALNSLKVYEIVAAPYTKFNPCYVIYPDKNEYVYSLATVLNLTNPEWNLTYTFVQVAENIQTTDVTFSIIHVNKSICDRQFYVNRNLVVSTIHLWSGTHQEYMLVKVNPSQTHAYVFADSFVFSFGIVNNSIVELINMTTFIPSETFVPHALDITDTWGVAVGFFVVRVSKSFALYAALLIAFHPLRAVTIIDIGNQNLANTASAVIYSRSNDLSVAVNDARNMVFVGTPTFDSILLFRINTSNTDLTIDPIRRITGPQLNVGFGRALAWIDENTIAVVLFDVPNRSWSRSEIWAYDIDSNFAHPLFVFPNNQQTLILAKPYLFLHIVTWLDHMLVLTDQTQALLLLAPPPGFYSFCYHRDASEISVCDQKPCLPGTFKNDSGFGPCTVCPPRTKNLGSEPCAECSPCLPNAFCPLASVNDNVTLDSYPSYTQTFSYPDTPDMNNFDDLIVYYMFSIKASRQCLLVSPLLWTIIVIGFCFFVWLLMIIMKKFRSNKIGRHRNIAKQVFKGMDIIGDGQRWIGGLFSLAIIVLFVFSIWFAMEYIQLYPIETNSNGGDLCDETLHNSLFDNALQLPLSNPAGSRWPIFDMLDEQPITVTLDLVNTRANCSNIFFQLIRPGVNYLHLPMTACILQSDNITLSVSTTLPQHRMTLELNITGPYFVGGFRLCLRGPGLLKTNNQLHALNICQFFSTPNQTLSRFAMVSVALIKVVNQTKPLYVGGSSKFDGRWAPTFTEGSFSDEMIYEQNGQYLRYTAQFTTLTIAFSEQPFFLQNNQTPVIRIAELFFHTLLFCTLIIDLFGLTFLIAKLILRPMSSIVKHFLRRSEKSSLEVDLNTSKRTVNQQNSYAIHYRRLKFFELREKLRTRKRRKLKNRREKSNDETVHTPQSSTLEMTDIERTSF